MIGTEVFCNLPGVGKLAVVVHLEANGEGFDRLRHHLAHQAYHDARIDPSAQKRPQGHFTHQANFDRIFQ